MGDDWKGRFDFLKDYCEVVYLERTPEISTTKIKNELGLNGKTKDMMLGISRDSRGDRRDSS